MSRLPTSRPRGRFPVFPTLAFFLTLLSACTMPLITKDMVAAAKDRDGFSAAAGNRSTTLTWTPDPTVASYSVYYTIDGGAPTEAYSVKLLDVEPPLAITDLANGSRHTFQLRTRYGNGATAVSALVEAIPLAPNTLTPSVEPGVGHVVVSWNPIRGSDVFEVWRADSRQGPFTNVSGPVSGTRWTDKNASDGTPRAYAVKPAGTGMDQLSSANYGASFPFTGERIGLAGGLAMREAQRVAVRGSLAYVASASSIVWGDAPVDARNGGLAVIDIANPESPKPLGSVSWPFSLPEAIVLSPDGRYAFVANAGVVYEYHGKRSGSVVVVDLLDPRNPVLVQRFEPSDNSLYNPRALALSADGKCLVVANGSVSMYTPVMNPQGSLQAFSIGASGIGERTAVAPAAAGGAADFRSVAFSEDGRYLFAGAFVDNPSFAFRLFRGETTLDGGGAIVALSGPQEVLATGFSDPSATLRGMDRVTAVRAGRKLHIGYGKNLVVVDIGDPSNPAILASEKALLPGKVNSLTLRGQYCFLACSDGVLRAMILNEDNQLSLMGSRYLGPGAIGSRDLTMCSDGVHVLVADGDGGLAVARGMLPDPPKLIGSLALENAVRGITQLFLDGDHAYLLERVGTNNVQLRVVDIANPAAPRKGGSKLLMKTDGSGTPTSVTPYLALHGGVLYRAAHWEGLGAIDVSDPENPRDLGVLPSPSSRYCGLAVSGSNVFTISYGEMGNLECFDAGDPAALTKRAAQMKFVGAYSSLALLGGYAYALTYSFIASEYTVRLEAFDLSEALDCGVKQPVIATTYGYSTTTDSPSLVLRSGAAMVQEKAGTRAFDLSNSGNPIPAAAATTMGSKALLAWHGDYLFFGDGSVWRADAATAVKMFSFRGENGAVLLPEALQARGKYVYLIAVGADSIPRLFVFDLFPES